MLRLLRRADRDTAAIEAEMRRLFFARWRSLIANWLRRREGLAAAAIPSPNRSVTRGLTGPAG